MCDVVFLYLDQPPWKDFRKINDDDDDALSMICNMHAINHQHQTSTWQEWETTITFCEVNYKVMLVICLGDHSHGHGLWIGEVKSIQVGASSHVGTLV